MKKFLFIISTGIFLSACSAPSQEAKKQDSTQVIKAAVEEKKENWIYTEDKDKMTEESRYFAECKSSNTVEFKFPYNGGSSFSLMIRNIGQGNEVALGVTKGQFITSFDGSSSVKVKFDDGKPMDFSYTGASDGTMNVIFIDNSKKFIDNLKKSKKVLIAAQFYQEGKQYMEFNTENLIWQK